MPSSKASKTTSMSARDYQHKKFAAKSASSSASSPSASSPRVVTPSKKQQSRSKMPGIEDVLETSSLDPVFDHSDEYENENSAADAEETSNYSGSGAGSGLGGGMKQLVSGKHGTAAASSTDKENSENDVSFVHAPTRDGSTLNKPSLKVEVETNLRYSLEKGKKSMSPEMRKSLELSKNSSSSSSALKHHKAVSTHDPNAIKVFVLLLQPASKIFELIQLVYHPNDATLQDLIDMIPANATEKALAAQTYKGICRPSGRDGGSKEYTDLSILASEPTSQSASSRIKTAGIGLGEIIVAIPDDGVSTGAQVSALSKHILANPKLIKLLKRSDPLAPKRRKSKGKSRSKKKSKAPELSLLQESPLEEQDEEEALEKIQQAMEKASKEAAQANAEVVGTSDTMMLDDLSIQESLDESYSSWSKSFDHSFSRQAAAMGGGALSSNDSICSGAPVRQQMRQLRSSQRSQAIRQCLAAGWVLMVGIYYWDPNGYELAQTQLAQEKFLQAHETPLYGTGFWQCAFLWLVLYKIQRFVNADSIQSSGKTGYCPFLKAFSFGMDEFKSRYSQRLTKTERSSPKRKQKLAQQKLRQFSLRHTSAPDKVPTEVRSVENSKTGPTM